MSGDKTRERRFQDDILAQMQALGWQLGSPEHYDRELALYPPDLLGFVQETQPKQWADYCRIYPTDPEGQFLKRVATQRAKADPQAAARELRTAGTLGVLRHEIRDRGTRFTLCQFKPDHELNPDTLARYKANRLTVVPELVYSPHAPGNALDDTSSEPVAKRWRIDLVLFVNGLPIVTLELKSEFKQSLESAIRQYKKTRLPVDPATKKAEPLLTFKAGALVHFAVSQFEVYMTTRLQGDETVFLPFNKGTAEGGSGNDIPEDVTRYATDYLWTEVLQPDNLLQILGRFVHLQIEDKEDWDGRKVRKETLIFPRYHQWDVVRKLLGAAKDEGAGHRYLVQHSAGSGKSNSIAWCAHQLSALHKQAGDKLFHSVIVVTDRTVLDAQLQDTIFQFEHADGVVGRINRDEGDGSKSEKLADALERAQPIIIVTIQTFPFVLDAIEHNVNLRERRFAIIADEAHSSQAGSTARNLRRVLMLEEQADDEAELSDEEILNAAVGAGKGSANISYFAFTATPKPKTLELFGRVPNPAEPPSKKNLPVAFHVYSMRQAIEEGFILDVLKNYTNYRVAYQLAMKMADADSEVESRRARVKLNQWVRLHDYNISQKVQVVVEHFREHVQHLLGGQAKAMVVTGSRKEAVRYKLGFDKYVADKGYGNLQALVAFSGDVVFSAKDPNVEGLLGETFNEGNMNTRARTRDLRRAFDTPDFQVMVVANKFQTGFDQPKLCAMYVDKKLGGVDCVQTLSRLNRTYPGKAESGTFVLDFFNDPNDVLAAFLPYYKTAELADVSDPDRVFDLFDKLRGTGIFTWPEVEAFFTAFYRKGVGQPELANICKPAVDRWSLRIREARVAYERAKDTLERTKRTGDAVLMANAERDFRDAKKDRDALDIFKKDLGSFVRYYEFMAQIVDYNDADLEKLSLYARKLRPMLRETMEDDDPVDVSNVTLSHYRLSKIRQQDLQLAEDKGDYKLHPVEGLGGRPPRDKQEELLSQIIARLNEIFESDFPTTKSDQFNYAITIRDKVRENQRVMQQIASNPREQVMLGDFPSAVNDAILESCEAHQSHMNQLLESEAKAAAFREVVYMLVSGNRV